MDLLASKQSPYIQYKKKRYYTIQFRKASGLAVLQVYGY